MSFTIKIDHTVHVDGDTRLLWVPRDGLGMTGVVENRRWRSATARAASEVEVEILTPTEFLDQIAGSPRAARELIQRLSQRLREADDRIDSQTVGSAVNNAFLAAKDPWLQRQFHTPLGIGDLPFVVGRRRVAGAHPWLPGRYGNRRTARPGVRRFP